VNESRYENNLLDSNTWNNGNSSTNSEAAGSSGIEMVEDEEEAVRNIFETLTQIDEEKGQQDFNRYMAAAFSFIHNPHVRIVIFSNLLEVERGRRKGQQSSLIGYLGGLVSTLDGKQQEEFKEVLRGLPGAVLGDAFAREHSRVLVDVYSDMKESMREDKSKVAKQRKFIDSTTEIFQQTLLRLHGDECLQVLSHVLAEQEPPLKIKIVLQQLIISQLLHHDPSQREKLLQKIMDGASSSSFML